MTDRMPTPLNLPAESGGGSIVALYEQAGPLQRLVTGIASSAGAGRALRQVNSARIAAEASISQTAVAIAATRMRTALVARAMPSIGSLATSLNCATTAVDQSLTNACAANVLSHLVNRQHNRAHVSGLEQSGVVDSDEAAELLSFIDADAAGDARRARDRMGQAKEAVGQLHDCALANIESARTALQS